MTTSDDVARSVDYLDDVLVLVQLLQQLTDDLSNRLNSGNQGFRLVELLLDFDGLKQPHPTVIDPM